MEFNIGKFRSFGTKGQYSDCDRKYKIIKKYPDKVSYMKDLYLCEEVHFGYRECFHWMDIEGMIIK